MLCKKFRIMLQLEGFSSSAVSLPSKLFFLKRRIELGNKIRRKDVEDLEEFRDLAKFLSEEADIMIRRMEVERKGEEKRERKKKGD